MPRPPTFSKALTHTLPAIRVTQSMHDAIRVTSKKYDIPASAVVRACIARVLKLPQENDELVELMWGSTAKDRNDGS